MRAAVLSIGISLAFAATVPSIAAAQGIVDLSKPQTGKSRFVLNADMTPADLGRAKDEKTDPVVATVSRVPACGQGCRMEQPDVPKESRGGGFIALPGYSPFDQERTRAYIADNALKIHNASKNERRKFRRRR
ncbi:MAG: hypothetical protein AB7V13_05860 [Pseudorhodoplanes sp.]|uniref:hypothetical protein n=1 Tax=Pseudorhodoplanes sp. TaxID=1934341 RepID=UPI003D09CDDD